VEGLDDAIHRRGNVVTHCMEVAVNQAAERGASQARVSAIARFSREGSAKDVANGVWSSMKRKILR
jgi:hypothetical protein